MKLRSVLTTIAMSISALTAFPAMADNVAGGNEVVVGLIDTGARASHQEFDYQGKNSTTDQIVAWYDFSAETGGAASVPAQGQLWDHRVDNPFDTHGHGTGTASAAVGLNKNLVKEKSFCPGCKLAIAKVGQGSTINGDTGAAMRWLVDTVKADVINISIGPIVPFPASLANIDEAIAYARSKDVLVTNSNGNGYANAGVPGDPGWASPYSPVESLSVGGSPFIATGATIHTDPEVVAKFTQNLASHLGDNLYRSWSGTSFSSPLVGGMAARLMEIAIANGQSASADYVETLLKYSASDTVAPPTWEGYGLLNQTSFNTAAAHAAAGTLPARPIPDPNAIYIEQYANGLRAAWNHGATGKEFRPTGISGAAGTAVGPSLPDGIEDSDLYTVTLSPGGTVTFDLSYANAGNLLASEDDIDVYLFEGSAPVLTGRKLIAQSTNSSTIAESISYTSSTGGTYSILVVGWLIGPEPAAYTVATNASLTGEGYYAVRAQLQNLFGA